MCSVISCDGSCSQYVHTRVTDQWSRRRVLQTATGAPNLHSVIAREMNGAGYILKSLVAELSVLTAPVCC